MNVFSNLVFKLSRMLVKDDLEAIAYLYRLPVDTLAGNSATGLSYLRELEKSDTFSSSNLDGLRKLLNTIQRCDLIEMVDEFEKERQHKISSTCRHQPCVRPQEESIRLDMAYAQAKKAEEELSEFQKELTAFCSRYGSSPDVDRRQFYTGMLKRLNKIRENCHQFITVPLHEIIHSFYLKPTQWSHGGRQLQYHESQNHHRPGVVVVTPERMVTSHGQRWPERLSTNTQGQASHSPPTQTSPPLRGNLAAPWSQLPQAQSLLNLPELHGSANMDYDTLLPTVVDTNEHKMHRDGTNGFETSKKASRSRSEEKLTTIVQDHRPPKLSRSRGHMHNERVQPAVAGQQQNPRTRLSSNHMQSNSIPIPNLKKVNSADDVLNREKSNFSPSRIPILTSSPKHQRRQLTLGPGVQHSPRSSCEFSGGSYSYSDCDFTGSTDSGVDIKEISRATFERYPSMDLSPALGSHSGNKDYAQLNKSTMEASSIYQKPQASLHHRANSNLS